MQHKAFNIKELDPFIRLLCFPKTVNTFPLFHPLCGRKNIQKMSWDLAASLPDAQLGCGLIFIKRRVSVPPAWRSVGGPNETRTRCEMQKCFGLRGSVKEQIPCLSWLQSGSLEPFTLQFGGCLAYK